MVDYSRFEHIDTDSDEEQIISATLPEQSQATAPVVSKVDAPQLMTKKGKEGRLRFEHEGRTVYEWEQSLEEVNIYIEPPDTPPFIDEDTGGPVKVDESTWTFCDGEININLQKMNKAEAWDCALAGRSGAHLDAYTKEEVKKKLMLERFQEEHPAFDFSGAEFNGAVPSARDFMGGVKL